ncbi:MAG: tetratricopeptide repeat protein [Desulfatitalea sp.]
MIPPEIKNDAFYRLIREMAAKEDVVHILEIGSSAGQGSTAAFADALRHRAVAGHLYCMEISTPRFQQLQQRYAQDAFVHCHQWSSVDVKRFAGEDEVRVFYEQTPSPLNQYPLERVLGWLRQDLEYLRGHGLDGDGIRRIKEEYGIEQFDLVLIDGSEFTGQAELELVYGARYILLDDINTLKNHANYQRLKADEQYTLVAEDKALRNGYAVFERRAAALPIHFFTIVLNGMPFIEYHIEVFKTLNLPWHWHIVEGVAAQTHDTAWGKANGGSIPEAFHRNGLSVDGTSAYLDRLAGEYADQITLYRPPPGRFWDGKLEMVSAPLPHLPEQCLLWQIDADELWSADQIQRMHAMFMAQPQRTAAHFHCHFFVGPELVTITPKAYSHNNGYEWFRVWRYQKGMRWQSHEPPRLMVAENGQWRDVAKGQPFIHAETEAAGLVFTHYAYALESQVRFKEAYYGYKGAVDQWRRLQNAERYPVRVGQYLGWVKDHSLADRVAQRTIGRAVDPIAWRFDDPAPTIASQDLHIVIDGVIFQLQHKRPLGIARVWQNLLPELVKTLPQARFTVLERRGFAVPFTDMPRHTVNPYVLGDENALDNDDEMLRQACAELQADLFVSSYYTRAPGFKNLLLVHDLIPELMGHDLTQPEWRSKIRAIETADAFATVSQCTMDDLRQRYPNAAARPMQKMHLGIGAPFGPVEENRIARLRACYSLTAAYLLMVGNRRQYKNSAAMWASMQSSQWDSDVQVLCVGGEGALTEEEQHLAQAGRVRFIPRLGDEELAAAYAGATALVCLSRYEGFGLPVLEAMACGCPVITAANGSLPEVAGDAAQFVDADLPSAVQTAVEAVREPEQRRDLIARGYAQAARFTWQRSAEAMAALIRTMQGQAPVLVSAIVSTYNSERFIRGCLEDLLAQTLADRMEIIVIDSASEQNEGEVVREFAARHHRIKYLRTPNRESLYAAWNRGIKLAQGKYVTNANTDDRHRPDAFEKMVAVLEAEPQTALVYADVIKTATPNQSLAACTPIGVLSWFDWRRERLLTHGCFMGPQPMWRRSVHAVFGFFDERMTVSADYEFWLRISQAFDFRRIPEPLGLYLERGDSVEHADRDRKRAEERMVHERYRNAQAEGAIHGFKPFEALRRAAQAGDPGAMRLTLEEIQQIARSANGSTGVSVTALGNELAAAINRGAVTEDRIERFIHDASHLFLARGAAMDADAKRADDRETNREKQNINAIGASRDHSLKGDHTMQFADKIQQGVHCLLKGGHSEVAQWLLEKLLNDSPDHAQAHHERAMIAHQQGDKHTAGLHFQRAAELAPRNPVLQKSLGDFYHVVQGQAGAAIGQYQKVLALAPNDLETLLTAAHLCTSLRRFDEARKYYQKVLELAPGHAEARKILTQLTAAQPAPQPQVSPETLYQTACRQVEQGQAREAAQTLERVIAMDPNHALAHNDLGVLSFENGDKDKAQRLYEEACRLAPYNGVFHKNLADFYYIERGNAEQALAKYVQALTLDPQDVESLMGTGCICMALGRSEDARVFFNRTLEIEPWHAEALRWIEQLEASARPAVAAMQSRDLYATAQSQATGGDFKGDIQALQTLVAKEPHHARAYNDLGVLHYEQGDKDQAVRYYEQAVRLAPHDPTFLKNLADFYFVEQGRTQEALRIYVQILESNREDVECMMAAGTICATLGKSDDARDFFERILQIEPWHAQARENLDHTIVAPVTAYGGHLAALGQKRA